MSLRIAVTLLIMTIGVGATVVPANAQVASALLRSSDVLAGPYDPIFQFGNANPAVQDNGDFVFFVRTRNILTQVDTDHYWGSTNGAPPAVLRTEDPTKRQRSLSNTVDLDTNGSLIYTSNLADLPLPAA